MCIYGSWSHEDLNLNFLINFMKGRKKTEFDIVLTKNPLNSHFFHKKQFKLESNLC